MDKVLYGVAYYREYLPYERLEEDVKLMKEANINLVRIGESTWSTYEPEPGKFDFSSLDTVLAVMEREHIQVVIGTPTYAIPSWMVKRHPEVMVTTAVGQKSYGARQIMDILNSDYRFYAKRIIEKMIQHVADHPAVIGYQIDNETKHYGTSGENVQREFIKHLRAKFKDSVDALNKAFGLAYWSNSIHSWEDLPSMVGTINGSLGLEFDRYQRQLVTEFLNWQSELVRKYKREDQFITHNFDFEWRKYSFGVQPDVDHFAAAKTVDVTGVDIYHPSQDDLTGREIAFCGDLAWSTKEKNYFVLETQAQAFKKQVPYPGQLTVQAFSHLASGAGMIEYWHWHSIHNSYETYWKGILSHDLKKNIFLNEIAEIGQIFKKHSANLLLKKKEAKVALIINNDSLSAMKWFPFSETKNYNDLIREYYDAFYDLNIAVDVVAIQEIDLQKYVCVVIPGLYAADDHYLEAIKQFVAEGGTALFSFKSGFSNENNQVRSVVQPGLLSDCCGLEYTSFVDPKGMGLVSSELPLDNERCFEWAELLTPTTGVSLAKYMHQYWGEYSAIIENTYQSGHTYYVGCYLNKTALTELVRYIAQKQSLFHMSNEQFPIIHKSGINQLNKKVHYLFNYSNDPQQVIYSGKFGMSLLTNEEIQTGAIIQLTPWHTMIIEEQ